MVWRSVPEITCAGSPTAIGTAHGTVARARIHASIANYTALYASTAGITWAEARTRAQAYVAPLRRHSPHLADEMDAIAAAAGVDLLDVVALNVRSEISLTNYSDGCTTVGQAPAGGREGVWLAQNWDWLGETGDATVLMDLQRDGAPRVRMFGEAGLVGKFGFNDAGLGLCMNAIRSGSVDPEKLPVHVAVRKVLECRSFDEALALLDSEGVASAVHLAIADSSGKLASVECSPLGNTVIWPDAEGTVCHSNHLYAPGLPQGLRDHPSANSFSRLARMQELSKGQEPSFEGIRERMCDRQGAPTSIDRSPPEGAQGIERMETLCTIIMDLKAKRAELSLGRPSLKPEVKVLTL